MNKIFRCIIPAFLQICIITSLFTSCIEEYNAMLPTSESDVLVVEGSILSDTISTFYLSLSMPVNSSVGSKEVSNATVQLLGNDGTTVTATSNITGRYDIATPKLNANTLYKIVINYNGDTYESEEQTPFPSIGVQNVEFNQKTEDSAVDILVTTAPPADKNETQYFRWTYHETWEVRPEYRADYYWDNNRQKAVKDSKYYPSRGWISTIGHDILASSSAYYSNNQIVQYKLYDVSNNDRRLFVEYSTEVVQRSLRKAEYEYETERRKISKDMGGLFTPQPSSLPSNIHCMTSDKNALGYVGCSLNVARFRMYVFPDQINVIHDIDCGEKTSDGANSYEMENILHGLGYKLYGYEHPMGAPETFYWANPNCVDVRTFGASTEKPDYWLER